MIFDLKKFLSTEAILKLNKGYYPCPTVVVDIIKTLVKAEETNGCLLDNCAGTGEIAMQLADQWHLQPYLIEPHFGRFIACAAKVTNSLCAYAEQVVLQGIPTVWYFNPPFDPEDATGALEKKIFAASLRYAVGVGTLCILLLPARALQDSYFQQNINMLLPDPIIRAFPAPFFAEYQQVVILGHAKPETRKNHTTVFHEELTVLTANEFVLPLTKELSSTLVFSVKSNA